jgi:hypothetical protein
MYEEIPKEGYSLKESGAPDTEAKTYIDTERKEGYTNDETGPEVPEWREKEWEEEQARRKQTGGEEMAA